MTSFQTPIVTVPASFESEEALVGAVLTGGDNLYDDIALWLKTEHFYLLRFQYLWAAMGRIRERRDHIDTLTVQEELRLQGRLDDIGGPAFLIQLLNGTGQTYHAEIYARMVERMAIRRRLIAAGDAIRGMGYDYEIAVEHALAEAEKAVTAVADDSMDETEEDIVTVLGRQMDMVEERMKPENEGKILGVPFGFRDLDGDLVPGMQRDQLIVIAGRPGMGKTSMMHQIAVSAAKLGFRVGLNSHEMTRDEVMLRLVSMEIGVPLQVIQQGRMDKRQWSRYVEAVGRLSKLPLYIDDKPSATPMSIRAKALRWKRRGLDLLVDDYLQLLSSDHKQFQNNRVQEVSYIARSFKRLAGELHVPVIAASQLSRDLEKREDKRPVLSDLRESGEIEQAADVVMFIYRDVVYNEATEFPNRADVIIAKHRNGPTGVVSLHFDKTCTKFSDARTESLDLRTLGTYAGAYQHEDD